MKKIEAVITAESIAHKLKGKILLDSDIIKLYSWLNELILYVDDLALADVLEGAA